jgi:DNA-directed RNA polymerase subunit RPC12/RpoP
MITAAELAARGGPTLSYPIGRDCGFCEGGPVGNAAAWIDGKAHPPAECPRCGVRVNLTHECGCGSRRVYRPNWSDKRLPEPADICADCGAKWWAAKPVKPQTVDDSAEGRDARRYRRQNIHNALARAL